MSRNYTSFFPGEGANIKEALLGYRSWVRLLRWVTGYNPWERLCVCLV
jgi:hypothetical protein